MPTLAGSGILHYNVLGQSVIVINSIKIARELLEMKSLMYSDRYGSASLSSCHHHDMHLAADREW